MIELFNGAVCFTPLLGLLDLLLIGHFCLSWSRSVKKTGWTIDFWYLTLFLTVFQWLLILYPFNASIYNSLFTLGHQDEIQPFVDKAFLISILGYLFVWIGRYLFDFSQGKFPLSALFHATLPLSRLVENNIKSKRAYLVVTVAAFLLGLGIFVIQYQEDCLFNARAWFLKQDALRPVFNFSISIFSLAFSFLGLRWIQYKEKRCLKYILFLFVLSLFFGVRSVGLGGLFSLVSYWIFYREGRCSVLKLATFCGVLFFMAVVLGSLREGSFDLQNSMGHLLLHYFYGNNFSDTRDFAWILAFWDGEFLYGKTYLAALLSFIPRVLSPLRQEWNISMYTNALTGFDSEIMPGLRPGLFGEAFLNFGYIGVVFYGMLFGFSLRYADFKMKECVKQSKDIIQGYSYGILFSLICCLSISASVWAFYVFLLINLALTLVRGRQSKTMEVL